MDQPVDRQWAVTGGLATWGADCQVSVVGAGPRMYLLGQQGGVFCGRLMPWSERLKTLQVGCGCAAAAGDGSALYCCSRWKAAYAALADDASDCDDAGRGNICSAGSNICSAACSWQCLRCAVKCYC
jgi:hypothetical protein